MSPTRHKANYHGAANVSRKELTSLGSPIGVEGPYASGFTALSVTSDVWRQKTDAKGIRSRSHGSPIGVGDDGVWCRHPQLD